MTLQLFHPGVAKIRCADCLKRAYNMETGEPLTYPAGPTKELKYHDGPGHKAPCQTTQRWKCPKGDPSQEADFDLSRKNLLAVLAWRHVRASFGAVLKGECDELLADNLAIIDGIARERERMQVARDSADGMALSILPLLGRG